MRPTAVLNKTDHCCSFVETKGGLSNRWSFAQQPSRDTMLEAGNRVNVFRSREQPLSRCSERYNNQPVSHASELGIANQYDFNFKCRHFLPLYSAFLPLYYVFCITGKGLRKRCHRDWRKVGRIQGDYFEISAVLKHLEYDEYTRLQFNELPCMHS